VSHPAVAVVPRPERVLVVRSDASSARSQGIGSRAAEAYLYRLDPADQEMRVEQLARDDRSSFKKVP